MTGGKTFWKCRICGDIHYGRAAPSPCPTCNTANSYVPATPEEAKKQMGL